MSHICSYCGNETAGADPCPWCNGSLGVVAEKPKIEPVIIHDDVKRSFNTWPIVALLGLILVVFIAMSQQKRNHDRIVAAVHDEPSYVVSDEPLFANPNSSPPQLAHTASISGSALPDKPKAASKDSDQDEMTDSVDETDDQAVAAPVRQPEAIQLSNVQMASQNDGDGHEIAMGSATVYNNSPYEVTNFDLYVSSGGASYRLEPFSGTADDPQPYSNRVIPPGARVTIPVMSNGMYAAGEAGASKIVSVEATENGVTVSSHVTIE